MNGFARYVFLSALISLMTIVYLSKNFSPIHHNLNRDRTISISPLSEYKLAYERFFLFKKDSEEVIYNPKGSENNWDVNSSTNDIRKENEANIKDSIVFSHFDLNQLFLFLFKFANEKLFLNQQKMAALIFINTGFLFLYLLGSIVIRIFFDELREIESQHMYDRLLNFLLFKVVFLGAILETKRDEMVLWVSWFAVIGFLRVFSMLCRDRCEFLSETSRTPSPSQVKLLTLLGLIIVCDIFWFTVCINSFGSMLFLLIFECFTLLLDTLQTLIKYLIHIKDSSSTEVWEEKDVYLRKTEFYTDASILVVTLIHYIQIVLLHGITFTLIDAVLFLNIRSVLKSLRRKYILYKSYRSALEYMETRFPLASKEELEELGDNCPICLESMISAQKLPCSHIFHARCLRLWLENHPNCPTCRKELDKSVDDEEALLNSYNSRHLSPINNLSNESSNNTGLLPHQGSSTSPGLGLGWDRGISAIHGLGL